MGFFTWTLANKKPIRSEWSGYKSKSKLPYGGYGCVMCPDGSIIEEHNYEGYGIFDGKDIYELLVDWNRAHLVDIMRDKGIDSGYEFDVADAYQNGTEEDVKTVIEKYIVIGDVTEYIRTEWKRELGIEISYLDNCTRNDHLPFPIKITDKPNPRLPYDKLPASISCQ